ncbi:lactonase family protein [Dermatophilaceae bacterium Soc4.6]
MSGTGARYLLGGYTQGPGQGLGVVELVSGVWGRPRVVAETDDPSWVALSPDGRTVYAVAEREVGGVAAWRVGSGDEHPWALLGDEQETGGSFPCHLAVSADARHLLVANYGSGSVSVHPLLADGSVGARTDLVQHVGPVGPNRKRQDGPHAHQVTVTRDGHVLVCDLGLDCVIGYALSQDGRLREVARSTFAPGSGPRHLAVSGDGRTAWVVSELTSTVVTCRVDGPVVTPLTSVSTRAPHRQLDNLAAALLVSPDGCRVLASNRGDDTVSVFDVEVGGGLRRDTLQAAGGHWPRDLAWGPDGELLVAAERSDLVVRLDPVDGAPSAVGWSRPTCLVRLH